MESKNNVFEAYLQWERNLLTAYQILLEGSRDSQAENLQQLQSLHPVQNINLRNRFSGYGRKFNKETGSPEPRIGEGAERLRWMNLSDLFALCQYLDTTPDQLLLEKPDFIGQEILDLVNYRFPEDRETRFSAFLPKIKPLNIPMSRDRFFFEKVLNVFYKTLKTYLAVDDSLNCDGFSADNIKKYFISPDSKHPDFSDPEYYLFNLETVEDSFFTDLGIDRGDGQAVENWLTGCFLADFRQRLKSGDLKFKSAQEKQQTGDISQLTWDYSDHSADSRLNECITKYNFWDNTRRIQGKKIHVQLPQMYAMHFFYFLFRSGVYVFVNSYGRYLVEENRLSQYDLKDVLSDYPEIESFLLFTFQNTFCNYHDNHWVWFNGLTDTTKKPDSEVPDWYKYHR